jgi:RNA-directed DNA polymerase
MVEGRGVAKGNAEQTSAPRTQSRNRCASTGLEGVRKAARRNRRLQFTALLHHITPQLLVDSFYSLQRDAAAGVDGVTWREYEKIPWQHPQGNRENALRALCRKLHEGIYDAQGLDLNEMRRNRRHSKQCKPKPSRPAPEKSFSLGQVNGQKPGE